MSQGLLSRHVHKGQSLVELILVMIVLIPVLLAVGYTGIAMYQGTMASEAIKEPATAKSELANTSAAIPTSKLLAMTKNGGNGGTPLDAVSVSAPVSANTVMIVGQKKSITIPFFNITMDFTVAQPIQKSLLEANTGTRSSAPNQAPPNLIGKKGPPNENPKFQNDNLPATLECSPAGTTITEASVNAYAPDAPAAVYDSRVTFSISVKMTEDAVMAFANSPDVKFGAGCVNADAPCAGEEADLQPKPAQNVLGCFQTPAAPPPTVIVAPDPAAPAAPPAAPPAMTPKPMCVQAIYHENPKGAPGQKLEIKYDQTTGAEIKTFTEMFGPPHGLYYDASGQYEKPPATFEPSCSQRKYYECVIKAAAAKANDLANEYPCPP